MVFALLAFLFLSLVQAATKDQWRNRSIYQIIVDRFALPHGSSIDPAACNPAAQTWCGGTWNSIRENLDYIQSMGFSAIWISPVNSNIEDDTAYGNAYHGYWIKDISQLNAHFGTADDLKSLSNALHQRGMYLMVDVVVNNVAATSITPDYSQYFFNDASFYHPYCKIDWGNSTSEQQCWMGDTKVALADINTEDPDVVNTYNQWIASMVSEYGIDGLRIDAAKHVQAEFWPVFCGASGVFCIGEVFGDDIGLASSYQGPLDSVLNFPVYNSLINAFSIPGPRNMSDLVDTFNAGKSAYKDITVLGNFVENHDVPRWANISSDPQSLWNAMTWSWMTDGIPIMYYGQEQGMHGNADPMNREALWQSGFQNTTTRQLALTLNEFRDHMIRTTDWLNHTAEIISYDDQSVFILKGFVITVLTNIGSPPANTSAYTVGSGFANGQSLIDVLSCKQFIVGSQGSINIDYSEGGRAAILVPNAYIRDSGICGTTSSNTYGNFDHQQANSNSGARRLSPPTLGLIPELRTSLTWQGFVSRLPIFLVSVPLVLATLA